MEQFIYDISQGKYDSFEQLFSENISENNIVLMDEVIAATVLKHLIPHGDKCIEKMYRSLIKDIHRKYAPDYIS